MFSKMNIAYLSLWLFLSLFISILITLLYFVKGYFIAVGCTVTVVMGIGFFSAYYDYLDKKYKGFNKKAYEEAKIEQARKAKVYYSTK